MRKKLTLITIYVVAVLGIICYQWYHTTSPENAKIEEVEDVVIEEVEEDIEMVYICTGPYATTYHRNPYCQGLNSCSAEIIKLPIDEVVGRRRPCRRCY
jgi:hypothetical protein